MTRQIIRYWGRKSKDLANYYIQLYSKPNEIVVDLFGGAGVFVKSALELGRRAIYVDLNPFAELIARTMVKGCNIIEYQNAAQKILNKEKLFVKLNGKKIAINPRLLFWVKCPCGKEIEAKSITFTRIYHVNMPPSKQLNGNKAKIFRTIHEKGIISHENLQEIHNNIRPKSLSNALKSLIKDKLIDEKMQPINVQLLNSCECGRKSFDLKQSSSVFVVEGDLEPSYWYPTDSLYYNNGIAFLKRRDVTRVNELFLSRSLAILSAMWHDILSLKVSKETKDCLKLTFMTTLARSSKMCRSSGGTWPINSYWIPRIFTVKNPYVAFESAVKQVSHFLESYQKFECGGLKKVLQNHVRVAFRVADSAKIYLPKNSIDYVIIDPPHTDDVQFFELSFFYTSWLKRKPDFESEIVINKNQGKSLEDYMNKLQKIALKVNTFLKAKKFFTVVLHEDDEKILDKYAKLISNTGFKIISKEQIYGYQVYTFQKI